MREPANPDALQIRVLTIRLGLVAAIYLGLRYLISLQTKKQMQATSVADTGMPSPPRLIPPPFTPTSTHYCLGGHALPRPASRFATKQFAASHRSSIDLSHLLSSGGSVASRRRLNAQGSRSGWLQTRRPGVVTSDLRLTASSCARARTRLRNRGTALSIIILESSREASRDM